MLGEVFTMRSMNTLHEKPASIKIAAFFIRVPKKIAQSRYADINNCLRTGLGLV
ncbi:hypothetical protein EC900091_3789 [Escherichia coli 90.0091]|nr:hypothetical protein EC900091_3789 [Escherichia coli 90.0091]